MKSTTNRAVATLALALGLTLAAPLAGATAASHGASLGSAATSGGQATGQASVGSTHQARKRTPRCVTRREFRRIRMGMTPRRVKRVTGVWGRITYTSRTRKARWVTRKYRACRGRYSSVTIHFDNIRERNWTYMGRVRVDGKSAYWS